MKYVYKLVVILGAFMLFSCSEEALPSKSLHATNETVTTSQLQLYPEVSEIIDYYTVLYEQGDILELSLHQKKVETKYVQETTHKTFAEKHDFTTTSKLKFARWCAEQLEAGHVLTIGYNKETGTYWGDIVG